MLLGGFMSLCIEVGIMKINKLLVAVVLLTFVITLLAYPALPEQIPTHWNMNGEVDGYSPKWMSIILGGLPAFMYGLFWVMPKIDPKQTSFFKFSKAYERVRLILVLFMVLMQIITLIFALGIELPIDFIVKIGISILFIVMGNYLGQVKPNYTFGIRTPWTLASDDVWIKTHRMSSYLMVISGFLMLLCAFLSGTLGMMLYFACIFIPTLFSIGYSYYLYQRQNDKKDGIS